MTSYFHLCKAKLGIGSIIEPGNFGEIIQLYGYKHNAFQREMLLEEVRRSDAPSAPSRLQCLFVFATMQDAHMFQMREYAGFGTDYLYQVEPTEDCAPYFAQLGAIENWHQGDQGVKASLYWNKAEGAVNGAVTAPPGMGVWAGFQEILLGCSARVTARIGRLVI